MQEVGRQQQQDIFYAPHLDAKVNQATLFYLKSKDWKKNVHKTTTTKPRAHHQIKADAIWSVDSMTPTLDWFLEKMSWRVISL